MYIPIYLHTYIRMCKLQIFTFYRLYFVPVINFFFFSFWSLSSKSVLLSPALGFWSWDWKHFSADTMLPVSRRCCGRKELASFPWFQQETSQGVSGRPPEASLWVLLVLTDHLLPPAPSCKYISELCSERQPFLSPSLKATSSNLFLPWCGRWNSKDSPLCPCPV